MKVNLILNDELQRPKWDSIPQSGIQFPKMGLKSYNTPKMGFNSPKVGFNSPKTGFEKRITGRLSKQYAATTYIIYINNK